MQDVYYNPEQYGLEKIAEIDGDGGYEFDLLVVWKQPATGKWFWAQDSGCSCPSPFDGYGINDLTELVLPDFKEVCSKRDDLSDAMELYRKVEEKIKEAP